jgi:hypothetical protein
MLKGDKPSAPAVPKKKGRPPAPLETMQVAVRLPKTWVEKFREAEGGVTRAIRDRLEQTIISEGIDPKFLKLFGQVEELSKRVSRYYGAEWHQDLNAHRTFVEAVRRLLSDLPEPAASAAETQHTPELVAEVIYRDYVRSAREDEKALEDDVQRTAAREQLGALLKQQAKAAKDTSPAGKRRFLELSEQIASFAKVRPSIKTLMGDGNG